MYTGGRYVTYTYNADGQPADRPVLPSVNEHLLQLYLSEKTVPRKIGVHDEEELCECGPMPGNAVILRSSKLRKAEKSEGNRTMVQTVHGIEVNDEFLR